MTVFPVAAGSRITSAVINHAYTIADANVTTVTAASYAELSTVYQIPANDAAVGMAYELTCFGYGTWGSTAQTLQLGLNLNGSIMGIAPTIGSTAFATSEGFRWRISLILIPVTIGATATWMGSIEGVVCQTANNILPGAGNQDSVPLAGGNSTAVTHDSTAGNDFSLQAQWGATTGASTITCTGTRYTRCG